MKKILTALEMKRDDAAAIASGTPEACLMEAAATAALDVLLEEFDTSLVLFCCGSGNNGGDGLAMARLFAEKGGSARVCYLGAWRADGTPDTDKMSPGCAAEYARLPREIPVSREPQLTGVSAVVDAIFGIGLTRPIEGERLDAVCAINAANIPVLAVDIPSGVSADSGAVLGVAVRATATVAMAALKYGHILFPGCQLCGRVTVADIGIPVTAAKGALLERAELALLPPRPRRAHKGSFGRVLVIGGAMGSAGAAHLAAKAAYRAGAGLVEILAPEENRLIHQIALPEALLTCYREENATAQLAAALARADAVAIGMGLSQNDTAKVLLEGVLATQNRPLVIDADALNLISASPTLRAMLITRGNAVLTPHMKEAARLLGLPTAVVAADLPRAAEALATTLGAVAVLKDAHTVIAAEDALFINTFGNSGMATGGSGDVLAGIIASLLAQGATKANAAIGGVLAHALAGDAAKEALGGHGMLAGDIADALCHVLP